MDTIKNNKILILKASHTLIFRRKNSGFQDLKANNFAFNAALATFKISTSFMSYRQKYAIHVPLRAGVSVLPNVLVKITRVN